MFSRLSYEYEIFSTSLENKLPTANPNVRYEIINYFYILLFLIGKSKFAAGGQVGIAVVVPEAVFVATVFDVEGFQALVGGEGVLYAVFSILQ